MSKLRILSKAEQVAEHLRDEIRRGTWRDQMPGRDRLAEQLAVSPPLIQRGLGILEREGLLIPQGDRKRRRISRETAALEPRPIHVGILGFEPEDLKRSFLADLQHQLSEKGHRVTAMPRTLIQLRMQVSRIARMVENYDVDAWVIQAAPKHVLEYFHEQPGQVFAVHGYLKLPMAGSSVIKKSAFEEALNRLLELGHRRIVFLIREEMKTPPSAGLQVFMDVMEANQIPIGDYNMPYWEESPEGLQRCLDSLFATTPPSALIIDDSQLFLAAQQHLANQGIVSPRDVSLICTDPDRAFSWYRPTISHITWSDEPIKRRITRWVGNISMGRQDERTTFSSAKFVEGQTIGPAAK